jgi:hypothetical protein
MRLERFDFKSLLPTAYVLQGECVFVYAKVKKKLHLIVIEFLQNVSMIPACIVVILLFCVDLLSCE